MCMCMCVTKLRVKDGVCESEVSARQCDSARNDRGCEIVPRLPCETKVDVTKCHACHAKCRVCEVIVEGSLEVKLPTIWRDEKQSREEAERRERLEERRVEEKE